MTNSIFWNRIQHIIDEDFSSDGLAILEHYAEQFIERKLVYKRFSSCEQYGCAAGGVTNVIATILAGANDRTNPTHSFAGDFKRKCQFAKRKNK